MTNSSTTATPVTAPCDDFWYNSTPEASAALPFEFNAASAWQTGTTDSNFIMQNIQPEQWAVDPEGTRYYGLRTALRDDGSPTPKLTAAQAKNRAFRGHGSDVVQTAPVSEGRCDNQCSYGCAALLWPKEMYSSLCCKRGRLLFQPWITPLFLNNIINNDIHTDTMTANQYRDQSDIIINFVAVAQMMTPGADEVYRVPQIPI